MTPALAQRQIALAGAALLAVVVALALVSLAGPDDDPAASALAPETGWYRALAAPYRFPPEATRTACGLPADATTLGVAHPVLPCGAKITLVFEGRRVLTQVVDRGSGVPGRDFDVTAALAEKIGLRGVKQVRWRFAQAPS